MLKWQIYEFFNTLGALGNTPAFDLFAYLSNITNVANFMFIEKFIYLKTYDPGSCYVLFNQGWKNKFSSLLFLGCWTIYLV